jgi:hypothetical protein
LQKAFYTIGKYLQNPGYQATDAEVDDMAKFVVTHGGRAILNDIILRGYIYAKGGVFNGTIHATDGEFSGTIHATDGEFSGKVVATGGFSLETDVIDTSDYQIQDSCGVAVFNGQTNGHAYMPVSPHSGQQISIVNGSNTDKTLETGSIYDSFLYNHNGTIRHYTFTLPAYTTVTFAYMSSGDWVIISTANFVY